MFTNVKIGDHRGSIQIIKSRKQRDVEEPYSEG